MKPSFEFLSGGKMDIKKVILIVAVVVVAVAALGGYFLFSTPTVDMNQTTIVLSKSAYMNVPIQDNASSNADKDGIFHYVDNENGINVTSCNSNISKKSSISKMNALKNSTQSDSKKIKEGNVVVYEKNGTYSIFVKNLEYNNTVMLQSTNKNLLMACWNSLKFHNPTDKFKFDNVSTGSNVVNAVEETQSAIGDVSSYSSSSTSDSSSSSSSSNSYYSTDTSYTTSGDSWSYGGYGSSSGGSSSGDRGYTAYDFSG